MHLACLDSSGNHQPARGACQVNAESGRIAWSGADWAGIKNRDGMTEKCTSRRVKGGECSRVVLAAWPPGDYQL